MSHSEHAGRWRKPWSERSLGVKILVVAAVVVLVPACVALAGAVTMWLWNALMPDIFKLPAIGFWQAVGLLVLSHILIRGGGVGHAGRSHVRKARLKARLREEGPEPAAD